MTIDNLIKVVPPPAAPFQPYLGPWEAGEAGLGTALPQDYKDFARIYGSGYFMEFLGINIPGTSNRNTRFEAQVPWICRDLAILDDLPYPLWPNPGGLLPFGATDNGDTLFWLPRGPPSDWGVVVWDGSLESSEAFDCGLTDFLAGLATGDILPKEFPDDLLPCERLFSPHSEFKA